MTRVRHRRCLGAVLLLAACGGAGRADVWGEHGASAWSYEVRVAEGLERAEVRTCFGEEPHGWLAPAEPEGRSLLRAATVVGRGGSRAVRATDRGIALDGLARGDCVVTEVELGSVARGWEGMLQGAGVGLASPLVLLWAPRPRREDLQIDLTLHLPAGVVASVPWERRAPGRYRIDASALRWRGFVAFGRFPVESLAVAGGTLEIARLGGEEMNASPEGVRRWLDSAGRAAATILGELPVRRLQVLLVPTGGRGGREPVFFGATSRGGGAGVILFVNAEADDDALLTDWVAPHELSHFALPVVPDADAWLSEGFVTYYAEVGRARVGLRSETEAWARLASGCARGRSDGSNRPLAEDSAEMHETHAYQRVYWGGAALALWADVEIRRATRGRSSLDTALRELARCCRRPGRAMPAQELLRRVSPAAGGRVLERAADAVLGREELPPIEETLARLGVRRGSDGAVTIDDTAPDGAIRRAITASSE